MAILQTLVKRLHFILSVVGKWHQYNMTMRVAGEQPSNAERQKWGLSHQLLFDFECMIEGFIGLLADLESRYKKVAVLARKINQVPVSLGSHMSPPHPREPFCECCTTNYAHYSGVLVHRIRSRHFSARFGTRWAGVCALSHYKVETGIGRVQEQREVQKKMTERTKQSRNTQDPDAYEGARDPHKVQKIKFGKRVTPRVTFEAEIPRGASPGAKHSFVHLREPDDFEASWASLMAGYTDVDHPQVTTPYPVSWRTLQFIQLWDAANYGGQNLHRLTSRHFARNAFDRMNVGLSLSLFCDETVQMFRYLRLFRERHS